MEPTIKIGDHLATVNIANNELNPIERFDIVAYKAQPLRGDLSQRVGQTSTTTYTHRVVGMPGDRFAFRAGVVYVNGEKLEEKFAKIEGESVVQTSEISEFTIPAGEYVLLGDNRERSLDSRYWTKPTIARADIVGKVTNIVRKEDYDNGKRW